MTNPLHDLIALGQDVWLDSIRRSYLGPDGYLPRLIAAGELTGLTSNPSIFEKAVSDDDEYAGQLTELAGVDGRTALWEIMKRDVAMACDLFAPLHQRSGGAQGFVSIEVDPAHAFDTEATVEQGLALFAELDRPNVMVKVPGTEAGLPAITQLIAAGVNVNVTLLFSVRRYETVIGAFEAGLRQRADADLPLQGIASVASFFVSRVDGKVDALLEPDDPLRGTAAIANARHAYHAHRESQAAPEARSLIAAGARPQRPLWASTSTKDPSYSDVLYVEQLAGPGTVNTLPEGTLDAFRDHGDAEDRLTGTVERSERQLQDLQRRGIDLEQITKELENEGVDAFIASFEAAVRSVEEALANS